MARRGAFVCRKAACGRVIASPGYCESHKKLAVGWYESHEGKSSSERGYGAVWQRLRKLVLSRDCGLCQVCKRAGRVAVAKEVDHIVPKAAGGTDDITNLQSICKRCHIEKTQNDKNIK